MILLSALRPVNCLMASLAIFVGIIIAGGFYPAVIIPAGLYAMAAGFLISGAGMLVNDYYDFEIDKVNKPEKWRRMKKFPRNFWLAYGMVLFIVGIVLAEMINSFAFWLAVLNSVLLIAYSAKLKGLPLVGNLAVSYLVGSAFIFGGIAANNFAAPAFLALLAFLSNTGREIVKTIEDVKGDKATGAKTLAILMGKNSSALIAIIFVFAAIVLSPLPYMLGMFSANYLYVVLIADVLFAVSCFFIFTSPKKSQKIIKIAMFMALIAFLVGTFVK